MTFYKLQVNQLLAQCDSVCVRVRVFVCVCSYRPQFQCVLDFGKND